jgi:hypothetical protein
MNNGVAVSGRAAPDLTAQKSRSVQSGKKQSGASDLQTRRRVKLEVD